MTTSATQHAERRDDAQQPAFAVRGLENDHDEIDVGLVLGGDALEESALLPACARRRFATQFPVAVLGFDDTLRQSGRAEGEQGQRQQASGEASRGNCRCRA
jgi:hypothetical protein